MMFSSYDHNCRPANKLRKLSLGFDSATSTNFGPSWGAGLPNRGNAASCSHGGKTLR
jgi:hypothetical protein